MATGPIEGVPVAMGKYRVLAELGQGGMARVLLAVSHGPSGFSKLVVLKMIRVHLADDRDALKMFLDEARIAGRLNHPNVVHTLEVVEEQGRYMMVMEYLEGQSLSSILRRATKERKPLPLRLLLRILLEASQGLHYAHELKDFDGTPLNLVHRDVSPQNIFITYDGQIKVLDFGIAKAITSSVETKAGEIKGKIAYMSPEQFLGEPLDRRGDIYSMGAVLWQMATGKRLWTGIPDGQVINHVIRGEIPRPSEVCDNVHPELERITRKALARERDERYRTALELYDDLQQLLDSHAEKGTSREVGAFVAEMFADVRAEIVQTIERQLSKAQLYFTGSFERTQIPTILSTTNSSGIRMLDSSCDLSVVSAPGGLGQLGLEPSVVDGDAISASTRSNVGALANSIPIAHSGTSGAYRRVWWVPLVIVLALLGGFGASLWIVPSTRALLSDGSPGTPRPREAVPEVVPVATSPSPAAEPVATEQVAMVTIRIEAKPDDARIFFDNIEQAENPALKRVAQATQTHSVRVEARGYATRTMEVNADKDAIVAVALERNATAVPAHPPRTVVRGRERPATPASPATRVAPAPPRTETGATPAQPNARERLRNLDKSNPWN